MPQQRPNRAAPRGGASVATFAVLGFLAAAILESLAVLGVGGPERAAQIPLYGSVVVELVAAVAILISAARMSRTRDRLAWALVGIGVLSAATADLIWARNYLLLDGTSIVALADPLYLLEYAAILIAVGMLIWTRRQEVELSLPLIETGIAASLGAMAIWFVFVEPITRPSVAPDAATWMDAIYTLADFPFFIAPALLILLTALRLKDPSLLMTGVLLGLGLTLITAADVGWLIQQAATGWTSGSLVDFGFMGGHVLVATAAIAYARDH